MNNQITKIVASISFDEPVDKDEAIQTLMESVGDEAADFDFTYASDPDQEGDT